MIKGKEITIIEKDYLNDLKKIERHKIKKSTH